MVVNKNRIVKKMCSILSLAVLSAVVVYAVVGNQVSAAEVYPTKQTFQTSKKEDSNKLKEWLSNTLFKFIDFLKVGVSRNTTKVESSLNSSNNNIKQDIVWQDYFSDVVNNKDRYYINYLAKEKIVSIDQEKFNPDNFVRLNELSKIIVNSYRHKVWYNLNWNIWLSNKNNFNKLMPKYYNTAYEMWLLNWIESLEDFERFVSYNDLNQMLQNFKRQYPELINLYYLDIDQSAITIKRWDLSRVVFKTLMLDADQTNNVAYQDIYYHTNFDAIQTLANLDITNKQNSRFYPDNNISRWDFIVMFVRAYLKANNKELSISNIDFDIVDLDYNSVYAPYIIYAKEEWLIDYLFEIVRSQNYINIEKRMTKHEAYYVVSNIFDIKIEYDVLKADREYISRWEIAQIIVDSLNLSPKLWDNKNISSPNSQIEKFVMNIKSFANSPKIAWLLN